MGGVATFFTYTAVTIAACLLIAGAVFLALMIPTLVGALFGLVVGYIFDDTSRQFLNAIGMSGMEMWQFGAMVGFVGRFFRPLVPSKK